MSAMMRLGFATTVWFLLLTACGRGTATDDMPDGSTSMDPAHGDDGGAEDGGATADAASEDAQVVGRHDSGLPVDAGGDGDGDGDGDSGTAPGGDGDWVAPAVPALAARPPMGWSSWNKFACAVSESVVRNMADAMATNGMREAGYEYVNIDDCWQTSRLSNGTIAADQTVFPGGIRALADYVHDKDLKLGIHSSRGTQTCAGRPGSQAYESLDAQTYALWNVDYVKYDSCSVSLDAETQYRAMEAALTATGRPIIFSIATREFAEFMPLVGQLWRTTNDLQDSWDSMLSNVDRNAFYSAYARPGTWNDPDVLEVGNGGMTDSEYRAQFSLWAMMAAPLIAGNDLTTMTPAIRDILTNAEVIAVDQDAWGYQGYKIQSDDGLEIWTRPLEGVGQRAVLFFNRTSTQADMVATLHDLGLAAGAATLRNLWQHSDLGTVSGSFTASVPPHDVVMLRVSGNEPAPPDTNVYVSDLALPYAANGWGLVERDKSVGDWYDHDGRPLSVAGSTYTKGLGVHGGSLVRVRLGKQCTRFKATIGIDGEAGTNGSVFFKVHVDGELRYQSVLLTGGMSREVDLDVTHGRELKLEVTNGGDGAANDHADWAVARLECAR